jgi:uridine phosphorylase
MEKKLFNPYHINATTADFVGNDGIGRYLILPGSDGRAQEIAKHFENLTEKHHPRGHHLYLGTLTHKRKKIEVATISTGMGCPSMEIILHELFSLGAKRFLRLGTAGTLQPWIHVGDVVNAQAAVRDEDTTTHYAPIGVPAIASLESTSSILLAAEKMGVSEHVHTGIVHCKSSLYAREFSAGPRAEENKHYRTLLTKNGVLASEMETSALFIQAQIYNHELMEQGISIQHRVLAGAILAIVSEQDNHFTLAEKADAGIELSIALALESIKTLASQELFD